jgi:parvulin-like peptidyl-prolyl isomerase
MVDAVKAMRDGEISEPVELPVGCSVLQVVDRREVHPLTFEEARPRLEAELFQTAFDRESQAFFDRMREKTYIERKDVFAEPERLSFTPTEAESDLQ